MIKEIPETSQELRTADQIPINKEVNKFKIRKEYRQFLRNQTDSSSDSDYERANLRQFLKNKENKSKTAMKVLSHVEKQIEEQ